MAQIKEVFVEARSLKRFDAILGAAAVADAESRALALARRLAGHAVWNINSTAAGGGVAEMLASLLGYPREYGIDARWAVIEGTPEFWTVTKRLHHAIQGSAGDGSALGEIQRAIYEMVSAENADELRRMIRPGDVVILHDPQTAGLVPHLLRHGSSLVWRCHIGDDRMNAETELAWSFLSRYLAAVPVSIFSRSAFVPASLSSGQAVVIPPSIDPFSAKCEPLDDVTVRAVLEHAGLLADGARSEAAVRFAAPDGTPRSVARRSHVLGSAELPVWDEPLVVQVSRWDPLKDPIGVIEAFVGLRQNGGGAAHLVLVGPEVTGVADDPEAGAVMENTLAHWEALPDAAKRRVHLAMLPTADPIENATIVNALQSHARVVLQKSLREGFGLTVTEAMWKSRAIVATKVGGIQDQIESGKEGLLVDDPTDLDGVSRAMTRLLSDDDLSRRLGGAARQRVVSEFLPTRHLLQYADLIDRGLAAAA
ncbi:MAG TPA: glycosyltransferase [Dehalococcoidia bacterium]